MNTDPRPGATPSGDAAEQDGRGSVAPLPPAPPLEAAPSPDRPAQALGRQLLVYRPDGPLGGTFTCVACGAQAWQPDLLGHAPACPYRP